ncbi:MAG TPA: amidase family protein [Polyangiales bacterium]|nr:amidase family protein [Polyangiales bacterium]
MRQLSVVRPGLTRALARYALPLLLLVTQACEERARAAEVAREALHEKPTTAKFELVEASIADVHRAIARGEVTCQQVVQGYIERAKAYNGTCTTLVTADGAPITPGPGQIRAGSPVTYPTQTVPIADVLPNFDKYTGIPMDLGRMETTISDPSVQQQAGMRVGIAHAGQVNALETINIRGERSVSCKGACDLAPSGGALPDSCPSKCEAFRAQPDALELAAQMDAEFGTKPQFGNLPLYCVPFAFKDVVDTKDIRSTANGDVSYEMDVPPFDSPVVARLREAGAIIYAKANAHEYNAGPGDPGGAAEAKTAFPSGVHALSAWSGQACNPYDTEREPRGSSSGSGVSVSANLTMCAICEQTAGSCKGPASRNGLVNVLMTHGVVPGAGGWPNQWIGDRFGVLCKGLDDAITVIDAISNPDGDYFDSSDIYTAIPKAITPKRPYASFLNHDVDGRRGIKPLAGIRIGLVREHWIKNSPNDAAIADQVNEEAKRVLRDQLGAELVETLEPLYPGDSDVPDVQYGFQNAFAEIMPRQMPDYFKKTLTDGSLEFAVPGWDVTSYEYLLALSQGKAPLSPALNIRRIVSTPNALVTKFNAERYFAARGDARVTDWASLFANARWREDATRAGAENWLSANGDGAAGKSEAVRMRDVMRMVVLKTMFENKIDVFLAPENTLPARKIGGPSDPTVNRRSGVGVSSTFTALVGIPEVTLPAGYVKVVYEPHFQLSEDGTEYEEVSGTEASELPVPMPIALTFWGGPSDEPTLYKVASTYESATKYRMAPPDFGPL